MRENTMCEEIETKIKRYINSREWGGGQRKRARERQRYCDSEGASESLTENKDEKPKGVTGSKRRRRGGEWVKGGKREKTERQREETRETKGGRGARKRESKGNRKS